MVAGDLPVGENGNGNFLLPENGNGNFPALTEGKSVSADRF
jgi:hypothetical protein